MKYKKGDKVVVEIKDTDINVVGKTIYYATNSENFSAYPIQERFILGKLSDFTKPEKIKFSEAEKKEFDKLDGALPFGCLDDIYRCEKTYPLLGKRLFCGTPEEDKAAQIEFVKAIENPELIEVVKKEKKYRFPLGLKTSDGEIQYLSYKHGCYFASRRDNKLKQIFTESETKTLHFAAINLEECKEEVK